MSNAIKETKDLAKAYSVDFKDLGAGHIQLSAHGVLVNYYPLSKRRTVYSPTLGRKETDCSPWDAVRLCLSEAAPGMKPKKPTKNRVQGSLKTKRTNPAGLKHLYQGDEPPWNGEEFSFGSESDEMRHGAWEKEQEAIQLRAKADELDEAT